MELMGVAPDAIFFVPHTVDLIPLPDPARTRQRSAPGDFLFVGRLMERKGLRPFLLALDRWARLNPER